jgi:hypothetical protein
MIFDGNLLSFCTLSCMTPPGSDAGGGGGGNVSRKKRRGIIEKRRRDRINNSLSELRRLVPTAFEKQGSAKLEKAEILQMTVDHLKMLHAKGKDETINPSSPSSLNDLHFYYSSLSLEFLFFKIRMEFMKIFDFIVRECFFSSPNRKLLCCICILVLSHNKRNIVPCFFITKNTPCHVPTFSIHTLTNL